MSDGGVKKWPLSGCYINTEISMQQILGGKVLSLLIILAYMIYTNNIKKHFIEAVRMILQILMRSILLRMNLPM